MTEFNNIGSGEIKKVQNLNFEGSKHAPSVSSHHEHKEIKNLDNAHSALVGRSMVKKYQKSPLAGMNPELVASVKESLSSFKGNERIIAIGDKIFDAAIAKGLSYEQAAKLQAEALEHFKD